MRKYIISITAILTFLLIIILLCIYYGGKISFGPTIHKVDSDKIIASSKWLELSSNDIDLLATENYSENVKQIIDSLEKGIPVILYVEGGIFNTSGNGTYITLSAFDTEGNVIVYQKNGEEFEKTSMDFYLTLEGATSAFIVTNEETLS